MSRIVCQYSCGAASAVATKLAKAMDLQKSTVSARLNELLNDTKELVERPKRKDRISGITIRPVGLPIVGQGELFQ